MMMNKEEVINMIILYDERETTFVSLYDIFFMEFHP